MKKYIRGVSSPKQKAIDTLDYYSLDLMEHVIKLFVYSDIRQADVPHCISEIATLLLKADTITIKPKNKKLKMFDFEDHLFGWMGDSLTDYGRALFRFLQDNNKGKFNYKDKTSYPEFEITEELVRALQLTCYRLMEVTIPVSVDKQDHTKKEYEDVLNTIFIFH